VGRQLGIIRFKSPLSDGVFLVPFHSPAVRLPQLVCSDVLADLFIVMRFFD
jgi:hypothetical protein